MLHVSFKRPNIQCVPYSDKMEIKRLLLLGIFYSLLQRGTSIVAVSYPENSLCHPREWHQPLMCFAQDQALIDDDAIQTLPLSSVDMDVDVSTTSIDAIVATTSIMPSSTLVEADIITTRIPSFEEWTRQKQQKENPVESSQVPSKTSTWAAEQDLDAVSVTIHSTMSPQVTEATVDPIALSYTGTSTPSKPNITRVNEKERFNFARCVVCRAGPLHMDAMVYSLA